MASIVPVGGKFKVTVRLPNGQRKSSTFSKRSLCNSWAKKLQAEVEAQRAGLMPAELPAMNKLIARYRLEVGKVRPFGRNKADVLDRMEDLLEGVRVDDLTAQRVVDYIVQDRKVKGVTAQIDLSYMKGVLKVARALWGVPVQPSVVDDAREILRHMGLLNRSNRRDRRIPPEQLEALRTYFSKHSESLTGDIFDFILASCFRPPSEITRLRWADLNEADKTIVIQDRKDPRRKIGNDMTVPLINGAFEIVTRQPRTGEFIFPVRGSTWSSIFPRACRKLGIEDFRLYDLRHEAISRLVESGKYSVPEMMLITGHKDPKQLMTYTQLRARDLHGR